MILTALLAGLHDGPLPLLPLALSLCIVKPHISLGAHQGLDFRHSHLHGLLQNEVEAFPLWHSHSDFDRGRRDL
ncbi:MAG: hypothetical protein PVJ98_11550 [Akkermansiaceae bacterium]